MKIFVFLIALILLSFAACKKSDTKPQTNNPPPVTDSVKSENSDTVYLLKSDISYGYDASGMNIIDSVRSEWKYDNKRRQLLVVNSLYGMAIVDSVYSSYETNSRTDRTISYKNNVLNWDNTSVTYLNASGKPDSLIEVINYYDGTPSPQYNHYFYHYNDKGQDTLENGYNVVNNTNTYYKTRFTYLNNFLDSSIAYYNDTTAVYQIQLYSNGDEIQWIVYTNGEISLNVTYTHYNILSGGSSRFSSDLHLIQSVVSVYPANPASNRTENYTYTYDSSNRVSTKIRTEKNVITQKDFLTYY